MDARLLRRVACPATMPSFSASAASKGAAASSARRLWTGAATCSLLQTSHSTPSFSSSSPTSSLIPTQQHHNHAQYNLRLADRRYQSTANRTKRALNIAPHASFLERGGGREKAGVGSGSGSSAQVATTLGTIGEAASLPTSTTTTTTTTTLLYNPPSSAPTVYQTPFKFLPKSDPRRRSNLTTLFARTSSSASPSSVSSSPSSSSSPLAPELAHRSYEPTAQKYHLSEADVAEIRRLRAIDPIEWSVHRLARQFQCSPIFVMLVVRSSAEHRQSRQQQLAAVRQRWGPIRTKARTERAKRREMLYNGDL